MKYLLDTNALLYIFSAPSELSARETTGTGPARCAFSVGLEFGDRPCAIAPMMPAYAKASAYAICCGGQVGLTSRKVRPMPMVEMDPSATHRWQQKDHHAVEYHTSFLTAQVRIFL